MTTVSKRHQWRPISNLPTGRITASCSRKGAKICFRCCSIQCVLGHECKDCDHLMTQDCKPMPAKRGRPLAPADLNFPGRVATQRWVKERDVQEKTRIPCPKCGRKVLQVMSFCGYCGTPMPQRQMLLLAPSTVRGTAPVDGGKHWSNLSASGINTASHFSELVAENRDATGTPLPIHELSSAVLDHGPVPAGCNPSGRLATLRIGCSNRTATPDGVLNPDGVIPSAGNRAASIGAPPFGWSTTQAVVCRKVAMSTQRGDQRAGLLLIQLVKAVGRCGPSPPHHGPRGVGAGQQSFQVP